MIFCGVNTRVVIPGGRGSWIFLLAFFPGTERPIPGESGNAAYTHERDSMHALVILGRSTSAWLGSSCCGC